MFETHKVSYSIGLVGQYLLHVRLRAQGVSLPGSPFLLKVLPNVAHAAATRLPTTTPIAVGKVGTAAEAGCGLTIQTYDVLYNACVCGGATVTGQPVLIASRPGAEARGVARAKATDATDETLVVNVKDNDDGTCARARRHSTQPNAMLPK